MVNPNIFREYDIRGIADDDLTDDVVELIGKAYATFLGRQGLKTFVVGRDVRLTSDRIQNALIKGISSAGCNVINIGEVPTPVLYFATVHLNADGGVMVTGSHNPIEFNGIKMSKGFASIYGADIQKLKNLIEQNDFEEGQGSVESYEIVPTYVDMITSKIKLDRKLKIVIDAGNGTAGVIGKAIN